MKKVTFIFLLIFIAQTFAPPILNYGVYIDDRTLMVRQGTSAYTKVVWWARDDEPLPEKEDCKVEIDRVTDEKNRDIPFPDGIKITYYGPGDVVEFIYKRGSVEYRERELVMSMRFNVSVDAIPGTYVFHVDLCGLEADTERPRSTPGRPVGSHIVLVVFDKDTVM